MCKHVSQFFAILLIKKNDIICFQGGHTMKNKLVLMMLPISAMALTSCGAVLNYAEHLEDYVYVMEYHDNFNVLQLTDIHWNANTSTLASKQYLEKTLAQVDKKIKAEQGNTAKIDLIEITGDQFMLANTYHIETFLKFFESSADQYGFMYTVIWGNHDRHGLYNPNWLSNQFKKAKHCIYIEPNDNLYGRSNFVINLATDKDNYKTTTKWQLANLDSGASFSETAMSPFRDYDYLRKDQTDWFVKEHAAVGETVPVIAYYHIPQDDNLKAWNAAHEEGGTIKHKFFKLEGFGDNGNEEYASDFFEVAKEHNLKAAFMGHAHNVDWTVEYQGVVLGLGVKTGPELYFAHVDVKSEDELVKDGLAHTPEITENFDLIGASLVTIKDETSFDLEHLYLNERANEDFVKWVKW